MDKLDSILITGTDLVGKTTLIEGLSCYLTERGVDNIVNKHDLYKSDLTEVVHGLLKTGAAANLLQLNSLLFTGFLLDALKFRPTPGRILIQDSYACRTIAFSEAYGLTPVLDLFDAFKNTFVAFDVTIHLSASLAAKTSRLQARPESNRQDHLILSDPDRIELMDQKLDRLIREQTKYLQLDTSAMTIREVLDRVVTYLWEGGAPSGTRKDGNVHSGPTP